MSDLLDATSWAVTEFADAELGDLRRTQRLVQLAHALAQRPGAALPEACGSGAMLKAAYRFFQYLCQLGKAEGGLRGMKTAQAGDLVENLGK